jgi:uncharacterized membrane protein YdjX (TVP38/TMEM64 family)
MLHSPLLKKILFSLWFITFGFGVFCFVSAGIPLALYPQKIVTLIHAFGLLAPILFITLFTVRSLVFFPATILTLASGILFGPFYGMLYTFIGENFSAFLSFTIGRYFGTNTLDPPHYQKYLRKHFFLPETLRTNGFMSVLLMRLLYFPFDAVGYIAGAAAIPAKDFLLGNAIGILPGLISFVFLGSSLLNPKNLIIAGIFFLIGLTLSRFLRPKIS